MADLDPWRRPEDGWPSDAYFTAVANELRVVDIPLVYWSREEDWEVVYEIDPVAYEHGPLAGFAEHGLFVVWRCDSDDEPLTDGFTAVPGLDLPGWGWVAYAEQNQGRPTSFTINELERPALVAAAVWALLHPDAARTVPTAPYAEGDWTDRTCDGCGRPVAARTRTGRVLCVACHPADLPIQPQTSTAPYLTGGEARG